jgi:hypothetical protein
LISVPALFIIKKRLLLEETPLLGEMSSQMTEGSAVSGEEKLSPFGD